MFDLLMLLIVVLFFLACWGLVVLCQRLMGN
jgi:hypothetical protein